MNLPKNTTVALNKVMINENHFKGQSSIDVVSMLSLNALAITVSEKRPTQSLFVEAENVNGVP